MRNVYRIMVRKAATVKAENEMGS